VSADEAAAAPSPPRPTRVGDGWLWVLSDGEFRPLPGYLGADPADPREGPLFLPGGELHTLPLGCFLYSDAARRLVLVDAGLGPARWEVRADEPADTAIYGQIEGGLLPGQFTEVGIDPSSVTEVVLTHLHMDHIAWLLRPDPPLLADARVWCGRADFEYFQRLSGSARTDDPVLKDYLAFLHGQQEDLAELISQGRLALLAGKHLLAPTIDVLPAPGHTPGHLVVDIHDGDDRILLLGDAITCPHELYRPH
jgi:glyoxylase-like metal-dependent hydrolase (beta-lactamase superfamily II)